MTKDLFAVAFSELSTLDRAAYDTEYVERLPFLMLGMAAESFSETASLEGFSELYEFLDAESPHHWNNPELYTHLLLLHDSDRSMSQRHIHAISTHVGLTPPDAVSFFDSRFLRLKLPEAQVVELRDGSLFPVDGVVLQENDGRVFPLVYRPYPLLFDDIAGDVYDGTNTSANLVELGILAKKAIAELRRYCPALSTAFCDTIGTLAFTGGDLAASARSYNAELAYLGGIFTVIATDNLPALVENLIHEYYHCRLWTWWLLEKPVDLPPRELTIVSPITQTSKPIVVMMQALLIYAGAVDYYRFVLSDSHFYDREVLAEAAERLQLLEDGTVKLVDCLDHVLRDRPQSRRFTSFVSDIIKSQSPLLSTCSRESERKLSLGEAS